MISKAAVTTDATAQLGDLTYTYEPAGNRTGIGGTFARTLLPDPVASATYDAANRQLTFGSQTLSYDANGNLTNDDTTAYTWDTRNRLLALTGPTTASFQYDRVNPILEAPDNGPSAAMLTGLTIRKLPHPVDHSKVDFPGPMTLVGEPNRVHHLPKSSRGSQVATGGASQTIASMRRPNRAYGVTAR